MTNLYFIRHGLSELGKAGLWAGSTDSPLAPEGREQATAAGVAARSLSIDYIISSPLSRAYDTACIIALEIGYPVESIEVNKLIVERDFGALEGTPWDPDFDVDSVQDAETTVSILDRARRTYDYLLTLTADNVLIVSHGSLGRALRHIIDPAKAFDTTHRFANADIVKLL